MDFSQYLDPLKERLAIFAELLKEKSAPLLEKLKGLPYYPYSVMGIAAVILLLLILLMFSRKKSSASKAKPSKASTANRPRPHVSGVAVGLSSHEEFNYNNAKDSVSPVKPGDSKVIGGTAIDPEAVAAASIVKEPVKAAPAMPMPAALIPAMTRPAATAPSVTAQSTTAPAAPLPPATPAAEAVAASSAGTELEAAIKSCQEKFQSIYMGMYIQFGFMSDFDQFRAEVANRINDAKITHRAISELKMTPQGLVLAHMASVAGGFLQSGQYHTGKGQMDQRGDELLTIYRYALNTMRENSLASPADVQNKLDFMERKVLEIGG